MAPDDQKLATEATLPPLPPRAERMSYLTSGSMGFGGGKTAWTRPAPGGLTGGAATRGLLGGGGGGEARALTVSGSFHTFRAAAEYERGIGGLVAFDDG